MSKIKLVGKADRPALGFVSENQAWGIYACKVVPTRPSKDGPGKRVTDRLVNVIVGPNAEAEARKFETMLPDGDVEMDTEYFRVGPINVHESADKLAEAQDAQAAIEAQAKMVRKLSVDELSALGLPAETLKGLLELKAELDGGNKATNASDADAKAANA